MTSCVFHWCSLRDFFAAVFFFSLASALVLRFCVRCVSCGAGWVEKGHDMSCLCVLGNGVGAAQLLKKRDTP